MYRDSGHYRSECCRSFYRFLFNFSRLFRFFLNWFSRDGRFCLEADFMRWFLNFLQRRYFRLRGRRSFCGFCFSNRLRLFSALLCLLLSFASASAGSVRVVSELLFRLFFERKVGNINSRNFCGRCGNGSCFLMRNKSIHLIHNGYFNCGSYRSYGNRRFRSFNLVKKSFFFFSGASWLSDRSCFSCRSRDLDVLVSFSSVRGRNGNVNSFSLRFNGFG